MKKIKNKTKTIKRELNLEVTQQSIPNQVKKSNKESTIAYPIHKAYAIFHINGIKNINNAPEIKYLNIT